MWILQELGEKHKKLNTVDILFDILKRSEMETFILNLNKQDQLFDKGINSDGQTLESIGGSYSDNTIFGTSQYAGKLELGLPTDRVTLFNTGDFYESFKVFITKNEIRIDADPVKNGTNLFAEWGKEVLGLTEESIDKLRAYILPLIQQEVIRILTT